MTDSGLSSDHKSARKNVQSADEPVEEGDSGVPAASVQAGEDVEKQAHQVGQIRRQVKEMNWKENGSNLGNGRGPVGETAELIQNDGKVDSTKHPSEEDDSSLASPPRKAKRLATVSDQDDAAALANSKKLREGSESDSKVQASEGLSTSAKEPASAAPVKSSGFAAFSSSASPFASVPSSSKPFGMLSKSATSFGSSAFAVPGTQPSSSSSTSIESLKPATKSGFGSNTSTNSPFGLKKGGFAASVSAVSPLASASAPKSLAKEEPQEKVEQKERNTNAVTGSDDDEAASSDSEAAEPAWNELLKSSGQEDVEGAQKVSLQEQEVITGEEDEETLHSVRTKLYVMDGSQAWKERGIGNLKINCKGRISTKRSARLVMRAEGTHRLLLNVPLLARLSKSIMIQQDRFVRFMSIEDGKTLRQFTAKLSTAIAASELKTALSDCLATLKPISGHEQADSDE